jgi:hypothetical protein
VIRAYTFLFLLFLASVKLCAQVSADSTVPVSPAAGQAQLQLQPGVEGSADTSVTVLDSSWKNIIRPFKGKSFGEIIFARHPFYPFNSTAVIRDADIKRFEGKELIFYTLIGLLLLFAFLKTIFSKYVNDLFRLFFRRTLKQRQITEQLSQTPLPSLIFNAFFIITAGLYLSFILLHYDIGPKRNFWLLTLYCSAGLGCMYLVKFLSLKFTGWVLNFAPATDSYIFIVFIINKVIGIFLLPFLILLAFTDDGLYQIALTLSWCGLVCLFIYRFILSYSAVHNQIRVKPFHFIIYLLGFEIIPLLLIYKLLFHFLF